MKNAKKFITSQTDQTIQNMMAEVIIYAANENENK